VEVIASEARERVSGKGDRTGEGEDGAEGAGGATF
jgi:hypothetical protein